MPQSIPYHHDTKVENQDNLLLTWSIRFWTEDLHDGSDLMGYLSAFSNMGYMIANILF